MSAANARKRRSDQMDQGPSTPTGSPTKKLKITQVQKQALIDNLQLEITERARQLRAQYALQCSDLRSRIERRINRVPISLRKMKMAELVAQHEKLGNNANPPPAQQPVSRSPSKQELQDRPLPALPSPSKLPSPVRKPVLQSQKTRKRKSSAIHIPSDKENEEPDTSNTGPDHLPVQKNAKRPKTVTNTNSADTQRPASRTRKNPTKAEANPRGVLSPRSHNSRTLPKSPIKDKELPQPVRETSPLRQQQVPSRPNSPSKSASPFKAATSAISAFAKRGYAAAGAAGARITRPLSREKEQATLGGMETTNPATQSQSPAGRMLPPPRPALATLTSTSATSIPTLSPQRTISAASSHSHTSEQSTASTNTTVVTKPSRTLTKKPSTLNSKPTTTKKTATTVTAASKTKGKVVISGSTVSTLSPKSTNPAVRRMNTTMTAAAKKAAAAGGPKRTATTATSGTTATGRVLRKRN